MVSEGGIRCSVFLVSFLILLVAYVQFQVDAAAPAGLLFLFCSQFFFVLLS